MNAPRTVTVPTSDHGDVTTVCPAWCNEGMHQPGGYRVDITHVSNDIEVTVQIGEDEPVLLVVVLEQVPFSIRPQEHVPFISVGLDGEWWPTSPAGLNELADRMTDVGAQLRQAAEKFAPLVGGEDR